MFRRRSGFLMGATLALAAIPALNGIASAAPSVPQLSGPIAAPDIPGASSHNYIFFASNHDLATNGYVEEEYFIRGAASIYDTPDGKTGTVRQSGIPYLTRIVVRRPADPRRFNGTAIVEWDNVSNYFDAENVWFYDWEDMMRSGYVWVGVSPQTVGVAALRKWNARRYGQLNVGKSDSVGPAADPKAPDRDAESFDIFTQVGAALKHPGAVDPLGGLKPRIFLATGESQSAGRLATYVNSVHPLARVYDGFLLLSAGTPIRTDLISPVFKIMAEHDIITSGAATRQPDTDKYRSWEVTGASHVDAHLRESREPLELRDNVTSTEAALAPQCPYPQLGTRVHTDYAVAAAFSHLAKWAAGGAAPPKAPQIRVTRVNMAPTDSEVARDEDNIAVGGIREVPVAVPTGTNVGVGKLGLSKSTARGESIGPTGCIRWGYSADFSPEELDQRYPSHSIYVAKVKAATSDLIRKGFILPADAATTVRMAEESRVGGP
ncbi:MAG TPA: alpha/beta hydrolase domain-containing protein [Rhizomicrobium sp.]|nr:alpha/beta hydrolase domain-containing protein [Rhizomicrobium sp.]